MKVAVIGSGIAGAATAYQLVRRGVDVVVVDAAFKGTATDAGAGIVCSWSAELSQVELDLRIRAVEHHPMLAAQLAEDGVECTACGFVGAMVVSDDEDRLAEAQARMADQAGASRPGSTDIRRLDPAEARELFPLLSPELGAVYGGWAGRIDGRELRRCLLSAAVVRGAQLVEGPAEPDRGGIRVRGERLSTDKVVVAAGAWTGTLLRDHGIDVVPQRGQISHLRLEPAVATGAWPVVLAPARHYLVPFGGSRVVAGATREDGSGFDHRVTARGQHAVLGDALAVAPDLGEATLVETRVGFRPMSPDGLPVVGALPGSPDLFVAAGFGASGLTVAPWAGDLLASMVTDQAADVDLGRLSPTRFEKVKISGRRTS